MVDDDDGRTPDHGHPISSPCEPNGSGELKIRATEIFSRQNLHKRNGQVLKTDRRPASIQLKHGTNTA